MQVSMPQAERIGCATVREHWPTQEMSWIVSIRLFVIISFSSALYCITPPQHRKYVHRLITRKVLTNFLQEHILGIEDVSTLMI